MPRLEGAEAPAASPDATKSLPDLVAEATPAIVRVDIWRPYKVKDAKTGKEILRLQRRDRHRLCHSLRRLGGNDTTDDVEFDVVTNNHVIVLDRQARLGCACQAAVHGVWRGYHQRDRRGDRRPGRPCGGSGPRHAPKGKMPKVLPWADPNSIRVGDDVVAIGYARDLRGRPTVTRGIISATRRTEPTTGSERALFADLIQTDASINHGNSGGPLLNMRGEVLGVNTYEFPPEVAKDDKGNVSVDVTHGIFFTRSSRTAKPFVEQIVRSGKVARLDLGCPMATLFEPFVRFLGWPQAVFVGTAPPTRWPPRPDSKPAT